jgi:hypothetical protein
LRAIPDGEDRTAASNGASGSRSSARFAFVALPAFVGAALLFVVEPMLAKWLLPTLGGNPATWSACVASFQLLLLVAYSYANQLARYSRRTQAAVHLGVLVVAAFIGLFATSTVATDSSLPPALSVSWLVLRRAGAPFFVLAATTPLLSHWVALERRPAHPLYALSNAGALVGLLGYPFLVEPFWDVGVELRAWAVAFVVFAVTMMPSCVRALRAPIEAPSPVLHDLGDAPSFAERARWLAYAFVPSVMLLAATNHITVDVAATPLLWVVPLAVYLGSFIVAFGAWRSSWRAPVLVLWILGALGLATNAYSQGATALYRQIGATLLALAAAAVACHGELAHDRPRPARLTSFYLTIAVGGALGGAFVSFVAPLVFADYYELELAAIATFVVLVVAARAGARDPWTRPQRLTLFLGCGICLPLLSVGLLVRLSPAMRDGRVVEKRRSFLGSLRVVDVEGGRLLTHGRIQHGMQLRDPALRRRPTMYFGPGTALARVMTDGADHPRRIGVVGLGVGTIAAYGKPGDRLRFYELDPNVVDIAHRDFTFLADCAASVDVIVGDGRLSLSREPDAAFDVLVLDAFASDSVPVHLVTREAFAIYARVLAADGLLLVNVSNRYLAVDRVVRGSAAANGFASVFVETVTNAREHVSHVEWAVAARDPALLSRVMGATPNVVPKSPDVVWTDTRASVLSILR